MDERRIDGRKLKGAAGAVLLLIGPFLPVTGNWFMGEISYLRLSQEAGAPGGSLLLLAVISAALVLRAKYKLLWITGVLSLCAIGLPFLVALEKSLPLKYGWIVLFAGAILIVSAAGDFALVPYKVREALGQKGPPEPSKPASPSASAETKSAYCTECGAKLEAGVRFCGNCGATV